MYKSLAGRRKRQAKPALQKIRISDNGKIVGQRREATLLLILKIRAVDLVVTTVDGPVGESLERRGIRSSQVVGILRNTYNGKKRLSESFQGMALFSS